MRRDQARNTASYRALQRSPLRYQTTIEFDQLSSRAMRGISDVDRSSLAEQYGKMFDEALFRLCAGMPPA